MTFVPSTAFCNEFVHTTAFCNGVFENFYYVPLEKRTFRDMTILIINTARNPIAFLDVKTPERSFYTFDAFYNSCI